MPHWFKGRFPVVALADRKIFRFGVGARDDYKEAIYDDKSGHFDLANQGIPDMSGAEKFPAEPNFCGKICRIDQFQWSKIAVLFEPM